MARWVWTFLAKRICPVSLSTAMALGAFTLGGLVTTLGPGVGVGKTVGVGEREGGMDVVALPVAVGEREGVVGVTVLAVAVAVFGWLGVAGVVSAPRAVAGNTRAKQINPSNQPVSFLKIGEVLI
jgi:hypothetical protein